jgi:Ca2+-binding RTX toxin-like protein
MARIEAYYTFNTDLFNVSWYAQNYYDDTFYPNNNGAFNNFRFEDLLQINGYDRSNGLDLGLSAAGDFSISNGRMSGKVTVMGEFFWGGDDIWIATALSLDARSFSNAYHTKSLADDLALLRSALSKSDQFYLSGSDDKANGFAGNDLMYGNNGNDWLQGGMGADRLYGGRGADDFVFNDGESGNSITTRDVIYDFSTGSDDLNLRLIDANSRSNPDDSFDFGGTRAGVNDVWFARSGSSVIVYGDTNGDARADFAIELRGVSSLTAGDFLL